MRRLCALVGVFLALAAPAATQSTVVTVPKVTGETTGGGTTYTGTANQVIVTGTVLSLPQDIAITSNPRFNTPKVANINNNDNSLTMISFANGASGNTTLFSPLIQFGGTTSAFPAVKRNGTTIEGRLADDSGYTGFRGTTFNAATAFQVSGVVLASATAPSAPASCGTSPLVTASNGSASFVITGGTGGTATGCTVTMPAATAGWNCSITNITQTAAHRADRITVQTASTTTSVTWEYQAVSTGAATAFTASDVFRGVCLGY